MSLFYFNTGVTPQSGAGLFGCQVWRGGTKQIPFECEGVPSDAVFLFACDFDNLPEAKEKNVIVSKIVNAEAKGGLLSKYAYFRTHKQEKS